MIIRTRWSRILGIAGPVAVVIGAIDPLEGSLIILPGTGMGVLGALLGNSRFGRLLSWPFVLVANAGFQQGATRFILQDINDARFASNLMMKIEVPDLDAWWREIEPKDLASRFTGLRMKPPTEFPWGREAHLIDLAGGLLAGLP